MHNFEPTVEEMWLVSENFFGDSFAPGSSVARPSPPISWVGAPVAWTKDTWGWVGSPWRWLLLGVCTDSETKQPLAACCPALCFAGLRHNPLVAQPTRHMRRILLVGLCRSTCPLLPSPTPQTAVSSLQKNRSKFGYWIQGWLWACI